MAMTHEVRVKMMQIMAQEEARKTIDEKINNRQECNREILDVIKTLVDANPMLRFTQILTMLELDRDRFNEESVDTLSNIREIISKL